MAQEHEEHKPADKGKGKAVDPKVQDGPKDKDGKSVANGKKDEKPSDSEWHCGLPSGQMIFLLTRICRAAEELSEEDQQLKNELDMLVERLSVSG